MYINLYYFLKILKKTKQYKNLPEIKKPLQIL